jgi:hypothetical protein
VLWIVVSPARPRAPLDLGLVLGERKVRGRRD